MISMNMCQMYLGKLKTNELTVGYTVPSTNAQTVIKDLAIYNEGTDDVTVEVFINDVTFVKQTIGAEDSLFAEREWTMVLNPGDTISFRASKPDVINIIMSGAETAIVED